MRFGKYFESKIGRLYVAVEDDFVVRLYSGEAGKGDIVLSAEEVNVQGISEIQTAQTLELLDRTIEEITEYLDGKRRSFDIPLATVGTLFQEKVWAALRDIPYGETRTYGEIAAAVGNPKGARAVGMACNRNPILILTPCHRVIGADGKLVGFGAGLPMKEYLLRLEMSNAIDFLLQACL